MMEKEMAAQYSVLSWRIPETEEPAVQQFIGLQELDMTYQLNHHRMNS